MGAYINYFDSTGATNTLKFDVVTDESWNGTNTVTEHPVETGADIADNVRVGLSKCQLTVFVTNEPFRPNSFTDTSPSIVTINIASLAQSSSVTVGGVTVSSQGQAPVNPTLTLTAKQWDNGLGLRTILQGVGALAGGLAGDVAGGVLGTLIDPPHAVDVPFVPGIGRDPTPGQTFGANLITVATPDDYVKRMYSLLETIRQSAQLVTVVGSKNYKENMVIASVDMDRSAETGTGAEFTIALQEIRFVTTQTVNAPKPTIARGAAPVKKGPQNPVETPAAKRQSVLKHIQKLTQTTIAAIGQGDFTVPEF